MKGSYLLIFNLNNPLHQLPVGRFGSFDFLAGSYLYVGSAMGSGGLAARLAYHQQQHKPHPHWHIDYLRPHLRLIETWTVATRLRLECLWCQSLHSLPALTIPVPGFGSRDTGCPAHLFYSSKQPGLRQLTNVLLSSLPLAGGQEHELQIDISTYEE